MKSIWLLRLFCFPLAVVYAKPSMIEDKPGQRREYVYKGPNRLTDVQRRKQHIYDDTTSRLTEGLSLALGAATHPMSGLSGAARSVVKAFKAVKKGKILTATGHTVAAPVQAVGGIATGAASAAAIPLPIMAGVASAAYQGVMMGADKGGKLLRKESKEKQKERQAKNVSRVLGHAKANIAINKGVQKATKFTDTSLKGRLPTNAEWDHLTYWGNIDNPHPTASPLRRTQSSRH